MNKYFEDFFFYVNVSISSVMPSEEQVGDISKLTAAVPFSFDIGVRTPSDPRSFSEQQGLTQGTPYNGVWKIRVHDKQDITVDAIFDMKNPHFVMGLSV